MALIAYFQSVRSPKLRLETKVGDGANGKVVSTVPDKSGKFMEVANDPGSTLHFTLICDNDAFARNPAVKVTIVRGLSGLQAASGWSLGEYGPDGYKSAQWDGGADYPIHGGWRRSLPPFPLGGLRLTKNEATNALILLRWVAEGIRRQSTPLIITLR